MASAHMDGLLLVLHRMPCAVGSLILVLPVGVLHVDILGIAVERGKSPGDVLVVPCDDQGQPGHGDARHVESGGLEIGFVPDIRNLLLQMHVVREHGAPARRSRSGNNPLIRSSGASQAIRSSGQLAQMEKTLVERAILRLIQRHGGNIRLGRGDRRFGRNGRAIAPRAGGIQIRGQRGPDARGNPFPLQLLRPVLIEHLHHAHDHQHGIHGLPWLRLVHQQAKLGRQPVLMRADKGIHAARVIVEVAAVAVVESRGQPLRRRAHGQHTLHAVVFHELRSQDLRCLAGGHAARHIHLPEAVLGGHIALGKEQIVEVGGLHVGNAMLVAPHYDGRGQARRRHAAVELGQGGAHLVLQPHSAGQHGAGERQQEQEKKDQEHAQHWMAPPLQFQIRSASKTHPGSLSQEPAVSR